MKPYVICHMMGSLDGRTKGDSWGMGDTAALFEKPAEKIKVDGWLIGRKTLSEFAGSHQPHKRRGRFTVPKGDFVVPVKARQYAVGIDPAGKCRWTKNNIGGDHLIEVLTEKVSAEYLDHLRERNISYIFGGKTQLDLKRVLEKLHRLFGIKRLRIDGGGHVNGAFLRAGLIDEFSLVLAPAADGDETVTSVFQAPPRPGNRPAALFKLLSVKRMPKNCLWIRYKTVRR